MRGPKLLGLLPLAALALAGCRGGSDSPTIGGPAASPPTAPASPSRAPQGQGGCAGSSGLTGNVSDHGARVAGGASSTIDAGDFFFAPTCLTGVARGEHALTVRNAGQALHNVSFPSQGIDQDVEPGAAVTVNVAMGGSALAYFCKYHRTSGMMGVLLPHGGS